MPALSSEPRIAIVPQSLAPPPPPPDEGAAVAVTVTDLAAEPPPPVQLSVSVTVEAITTAVVPLVASGPTQALLPLAVQAVAY